MKNIWKAHQNNGEQLKTIKSNEDNRKSLKNIQQQGEAETNGNQWKAKQSNEKQGESK